MPTRPPSSEADRIAAGKPVEDEAARLALAQADMPAPPDPDDLDDDDDEDLVAYTASEAAGAFATVGGSPAASLRTTRAGSPSSASGVRGTMFNVICRQLNT